MLTDPFSTNRLTSTIIGSAIKAEIGVRVVQDDRFAGGDDGSGDSCADRPRRPKFAGDFRPDFFLFIVHEPERSSIDVQLVAGDSENRSKQRVGLDRGVDQLRGFDECAQPIHLVALIQRVQHAAQGGRPGDETEAGLENIRFLLGMDDGAVDFDFFAVPLESQLVRATDDQRLLMLDGGAEDADVDEADLVFLHPSGN